MDGNVAASLSAAGVVQSGSMGVVVEVVVVSVVVSVEGSAQLRVPLAPKIRAKTRIKQAIEYFRFILFMVNFIVARRVEFGQRVFVINFGC